MNNDLNTPDAFIPAEIAKKVENSGVKKAAMPLGSMFLLAVLAGVFVAFGAIFATAATAGSPVKDAAGMISGYSNGMSYGLSRVVMGVTFCAGLILVVLAGAELFTGNNLMTIAFLSKKISLIALLRNWLVVYLGNFVGSLLVAGLLFLSREYTNGSGAMGYNALSIGAAKTSFEFLPAFFLAIFCNMLVCLAVWMCFGARSVGDKILAIIFPISAFVAAGFEHSVANMFFIPYALFVKDFAGTEFLSTLPTVKGIETLTWPNFFIGNLLPVTLGNILGGAFFIGVVYWLIYLRKRDQS